MWWSRCWNGRRIGAPAPRPRGSCRLIRASTGAIPTDGAPHGASGGGAFRVTSSRTSVKRDHLPRSNQAHARIARGWIQIVRKWGQMDAGQRRSAAVGVSDARSRPDTESSNTPAINYLNLSDQIRQTGRWQGISDYIHHD